MTSSTLRLIDANANRAREAMRVMEDAARFCLDDSTLSEQAKQLRHDLAAALGHVPGLPLHRDTPGDVGTSITTTSEGTRRDAGEVVTAAARRLSEALRCIEEYGKAVHAELGPKIEQLRYRGYELETQLARRLTLPDPRTWRVCVIVTEQLCMRHDWLDVARAALEGGAQCIQLREKDLESAALHDRAAQLVELVNSHKADSSELSEVNSAQSHSAAHATPPTPGSERSEAKQSNAAHSDNINSAQSHSAAHATPPTPGSERSAAQRRAGSPPHTNPPIRPAVIINDRVDIALAAGADGVHLGQHDLSPDAARRIAGRALLLGASTHDLNEARRAARDGVDYCGVGATFASTTKQRQPSGAEYLQRFVRDYPDMPHLAIGGITPDNIGEVVEAGARAVAVSNCVCAAARPDLVVKELLRAVPAD